MEKKQSFSPEPGDLYAQTDPSSIVFDQCDNMSNFLTKSLNAMEVNTRKVRTSSVSTQDSTSIELVSLQSNKVSRLCLVHLFLFVR